MAPLGDRLAPQAGPIRPAPERGSPDGGELGIAHPGGQAGIRSAPARRRRRKGVPPRSSGGWRHRLVDGASTWASSSPARDARGDGL